MDGLRCKKSDRANMNNECNPNETNAQFSQRNRLKKMAMLISDRALALYHGHVVQKLLCGRGDLNPRPVAHRKWLIGKKPLKMQAKSTFFPFGRVASKGFSIRRVWVEHVCYPWWNMCATRGGTCVLPVVEHVCYQWCF